MNSFVLANPNRCIGCRTCQIACVAAHAEENIFTSKKEEIEFNPRLTVVKTAYVTAPIQCRQCENAPCANVCPSNAIVEKEGVIYIDKNSCTGCKTCLVACPLGAIDIVPEYSNGEKVMQSGLQHSAAGKLTAKEKLVANKCDMCLGREKGPACVEICPTAALKVMEETNTKQTINEKRISSVKDLISLSAR
ncbi:MAG: 4Fe-4S dicluster domain-containing protein [Bacillota bacterium]|nr:4Fe-4S dicluster domain-containing protein [Bacillota bacterium]